MTRPLLTHLVGAMLVFGGGGSALAQCTDTEVQKVVASGGQGYDMFGSTLSVSGNAMVMGRFRGGPGVAWMFRHDGTRWKEEQQLVPKGNNEYILGTAVDGNVAAVGAVLGEGAVTWSGAAWAFRFDGTQWVEEQILAARDAEADDRFGLSVAVSQDRVVVGSFLDDDLGIGSGSAYVYRHDGSNWKEERKLTASDGVIGDWFGYAVSADGDRVAVSAVFDDDMGGQSGSVYTFELPELALDASQDLVQTGDTLTFTTCGGLTGGLNLLAVIDVYGAPTFVRVALGSFENAGRWSFASTVPPGLSGLVIGFQSYGFNFPGRFVASDVETVTFQ